MGGSSSSSASTQNQTTTITDLSANQGIAAGDDIKFDSSNNLQGSTVNITDGGAFEVATSALDTGAKLFEGLLAHQEAVGVAILQQQEATANKAFGDAKTLASNALATVSEAALGRGKYDSVLIAAFGVSAIYFLSKK